jgi:drug/metabolite transporter (DMT)-like permease
MTRTSPRTAKGGLSLHGLGVVCGLAAGAWLGGAEAPTKLVAAGFSPFVISLGMVVGVFVARWTLPLAVKGTSYVFNDLREKPHLIAWAVLAGALWAVANTLTVFAIRDVGLSIAFPLWNTNSLVGLFWGWLLFGELRHSGAGQWAKVLGGALAITAGACVLAYATTVPQAGAAPHAALGILAALGAGLLWGTMYIPYRKAYISGMNPLSFVTVFTFGELFTMTALAVVFEGGPNALLASLSTARPALFWLFLGGFCWVVGDLFQQYAAKYLGIGRGIPLSNTNQLWGVAWGMLVFGEFTEESGLTRGLILAGSLIMVAGAVAISVAVPAAGEQKSWREALERECRRYDMSVVRVKAAVQGLDPAGAQRLRRNWWEILILVVALGIFATLAVQAERPPVAMAPAWTILLSAAALLVLGGAGFLLWKRTRFS